MPDLDQGVNKTIRIPEKSIELEKLMMEVKVVFECLEEDKNIPTISPLDHVNRAFDMASPRRIGSFSAIRAARLACIVGDVGIREDTL